MVLRIIYKSHSELVNYIYQRPINVERKKKRKKRKKKRRNNVNLAIDM